jgi:hypothetical protein
MVHASMGVDIHNVSIHGWANNAYRTPSCLPLFTMPYLLRYLLQAAYPTDPKLQTMTYNVFIRESPWPWLLSGRRTHSIPKHLRGKKKPSVRFQTEGAIKAKLRACLVPLVVFVFKVGCCVEGRLRELLASHRLRELPSIPQPTTTPGASALIVTPIPLG